MLSTCSCWTGYISSIWEILQSLLCFSLRKLQFGRPALLLLSPPVLCLFSWFEPAQTISQTSPLTSQDRIRVFTCDLIAKITTITLPLSFILTLHNRTSWYHPPRDQVYFRSPGSRLDLWLALAKKHGRHDSDSSQIRPRVPYTPAFIL